ncbi:hypothetical protein K492DRAFT_200557 [Lichtheimia hyalospora FSU 10163]|nr:hypothetical protein K492DRAFT_200557 [Lichtheimia hyalospora FSU 10163]
MDPNSNNSDFAGALLNLFLRETSQVKEQLGVLVASMNNMVASMNDLQRNVDSRLQNLEDELRDLKVQQIELANKANKLGIQLHNNRSGGAPVGKGVFADMHDHPVYRRYWRTISGNNADVTYEALIEECLRNESELDHTAKWKDLPEESRQIAVQRFELLCSSLYPFELFIGSWAAEGSLINNWNRMKRNVRNRDKRATIRSTNSTTSNNSNNASSMPSNDVRSMTSTLVSQMRNVDIDIGMSNLTDNQLSAHMSTTTSMARNDASVTSNTTSGNISPPPQPQAALSLPSMVSTNELQISLEIPGQQSNARKRPHTTSAPSSQTPSSIPATTTNNRTRRRGTGQRGKRLRQ